LVLTASIVAAVTACKTPAPPPPPAGVENPNTKPEIQVEIPELFSPDPDIVDDTMTITIAVKHPVPLKDWQIQIQPNRRQSGQQNQAQAGQRQGGDQAQAQRQGGQQGKRHEGEQGQRQGGQQRRRGAFFEASGTGTPPEAWKWNGKSSRESGEMVQSATDYQFRLTVNDNFDNEAVYEGIISVDVLVKKEGDIYKIVVPSIVFPPSSADFRLLSEEDMRGNRRILNLIGRALNRFPDYKITVEGHANPTTPPNTPQRTAEDREPISQQRAQAVIDYLSGADSQFKIDKARLTAVGMGGTRTVVDYDDEEENWKNRRVEFILKK
jgi:outer membrane protein OmpA-like peptidoglycan-associated protein